MKISALVVVALTLTGTSFAADVTVAKLAVGTAIDNKNISGQAAQFDGSVSRIYCWTRISAAEPPTKITHVWYADGKKEAEVPLEIKFPYMRTWSSKHVWPAAWKVDILDNQGAVLSSTEFTVLKSTADAPH